MEIDIMELFSGIGGFTKGLQQAGFKINKHQFSEVDKHAIANYKYNFKNAEHIGSVTDVRGTRGQCDIITFGSPCQDFSLAGKQTGLGGERSVLILEAIRLITEIRPSFFIWENVKGAFSSNDGADFWAILAAFADIGGYRLEWQLLNTDWFLPQNRERIYLVGHLAGKSTGNVFPIEQTDKGLAKGLSKTPIVRAITGGGNSGGHHSGMTLISDSGHSRVLEERNVVPTLRSNTGAGHSNWIVQSVITPDRKEKRQNGRRFKEDGEPAFTLNCQDRHGVMITANTSKGYDVAKEGDSINLSVPNSKTRRGRVGKGKSQTLDTQCNQGVVFTENYVQWDQSGKGYKSQQDRAFYETGNMGCIPSTRTENKVNVMTNESKIRRLTEIECERLQGFEDNWTKYGIYDGVKKEISKTQRYKMCGNAVTVNVVEEIGKRILKIMT